MSILNMNPIKNTMFSFATANVVSTANADIILPEDVVVLSCALRRLQEEAMKLPNDTGTAWPSSPCYSWSLTHNASEIASQVTSIDRQQAEIVRNHFLQKLTQYSLIVGPLTGFKINMHLLLTTDFSQIDGTWIVPEKFMAIAYKMPQFYQYDVAQLALFTDVRKTIIGPERIAVENKEIKFLTKLDSGRKQDKTNIEFWFEDELQNRIIAKIARNNPLIPLLESIVSSSKTFKLNAMLTKRENYTVEYYIASHWQLSE